MCKRTGVTATGDWRDSTFSRATLTDGEGLHRKATEYQTAMSDTDTPAEWPRITDLSSLSPENIKYRNTQFLADDGHPYELGWGLSDAELRRKAWNTRNGDLRKLMREFPSHEPLRRQCAHWVHAVVGVHFFPDANHRTAVATLRRLLRENQIWWDEWSADRLREARKTSHEVRLEGDDVTMDTLYREDELYQVWYEFFEDELSGVEQV